MILNKRVFRELKSNPFKYFALFFIVILAIAMVSSIAASTDSIIETVSIHQKKTNVEDGEFSVYTPLNDEQIGEINDKGFELEKQSYMDISTDKGELRIFSFRDKINKIAIIKGQMSESDSEIVVEEKYATAHNYKINDYIDISGKKYKISGIGCVPDYTYTIKTLTDLGTDNKAFGLIFVSDNTFRNIVNDTGDREIYQYAYKKTDTSAKDSELKDYLMDLSCDEDLITDTYLKDLYTEINDMKSERDSSISKLINGSEEISSGLEQLQSGANELSGSLDSTQSAISSLNIPELSPLISALEAQKDGGNALANGASQLKSGSYQVTDGIQSLGDKLTEVTDELYDFNTVNLSSFLENKDNKRINAAKDDAVINKASGLYSGIIVFILIAFMFSVFAAHNVDENKEIVGTLYAMGYRKKELIKHFLILPVMVVLAGSILGLIGAYLLTGVAADGNVQLYSYPPLKITIKGYLLAYSLIMPNVLTIIINYFILSRKLSQKPLAMLRDEKKIKNSSYNFSLKRFSYMTSYRIRQTLRESKTTILMFVGMGLATLLMVWGFSIYGAIDQYAKNIEKDVPCEYTYLIANPLEEIPENGEEAYITGAETNFYLTDENMDVTIMGVKENSKYYKFSDKLKNDKNYAVISDAAAKKFNYKKGDIVVLHDQLRDENYCLTISDIVPYSNGLYFFMDIDAMRELNGADDEYYNTVISNDKIDIDSNMLLSVISRAELTKVGNKMNDLMMGMITSMIIMSIILFCCIMYLIIKMMIDRSLFSISLLKIFGYNNSEVKKMYLNNSFIVVILNILINVPLSGVIAGAMFPSTVSDIESYMGAYVSPLMYVIIIALILISYAAVYLLLYRKLTKISYSEVLKKRD